MKVKYKYETNDIMDDLTCELTEFFDKYLIYKSKIFNTYLYNDLNKYGENNSQMCIAFRVPGATRGHIELQRVNREDLFRIIGIKFYEDSCFGKYACYKKELKEDSKIYIGQVLDFSDVKLNNNII